MFCQHRDTSLLLEPCYSSLSFGERDVHFLCGSPFFFKLPIYIPHPSLEIGKLERLKDQIYERYSEMGELTTNLLIHRAQGEPIM